MYNHVLFVRAKAFGCSFNLFVRSFDCSHLRSLQRKVDQCPYVCKCVRSLHPMMKFESFGREGRGRGRGGGGLHYTPLPFEKKKKESSVRPDEIILIG